MLLSACMIFKSLIYDHGYELMSNEVMKQLQGLLLYFLNEQVPHLRSPTFTRSEEEPTCTQIRIRLSGDEHCESMGLATKIYASLIESKQPAHQLKCCEKTAAEKYEGKPPPIVKPSLLDTINQFPSNLRILDQPLNHPRGNTSNHAPEKTPKPPQARQYV